MKYIILLMLIGLGCGDGSSDQNQVRESPTAQELEAYRKYSDIQDYNPKPGKITAFTVLGQYRPYLLTVEHDGHKWVVCSMARVDGGVSIVHHPSCKCRK